MSRTQINFRLDTELLAAIKAKCEANGTTVTDFLSDAARSALGIERMVHTTHPSSEVLAGRESAYSNYWKIFRRLSS